MEFKIEHILLINCVGYSAAVFLANVFFLFLDKERAYVTFQIGMSILCVMLYLVFVLVVLGRYFFM